MSDEEVRVKPWTHFYWDIYANKFWPFDEDVVVCGRTDGHFQYEDNELSGAHCQFSIEDEKCFITDLASKNQTFLNLKPLPKSEPTALKCFDVVIFGSQIIIYMDENIFKVQTRDDIIQTIDKNIDSDNIFNEIKNKTLVFMRSHHPRLIIGKKLQVLDEKIANAYNLKEEKLSKYDEKAVEIQDLANQHLKKVEQLKEKIKYVLTEKEKLTAKIEPQIDALHNQKNELSEELEILQEATTL
jgi:hypothetical protein